MIKNCLFVGLGGFLGAVLRNLIGLLPINTPFPVKTLFINVLGSFLIGVISFLSLKHLNIPGELSLFLKVGVCGGFTTFSTFSLEIVNLIDEYKITLSLIYIISSVVLSILAIYFAKLLFS